jgi:CxC2 like cysteine cluster associated with KDZ transposases
MEWLKHREEYLDEILALEGPPTSGRCVSCNVNKFTHRCTECFSRPVLCHACCMESHQRNPYHIIEKWTGECFVGDSLYKLGLVLHLGHQGQHCPSHRFKDDSPLDPPGKGKTIELDSDYEDEELDENDIWIVHSSGIFRARLRYCSCADAPDRHIQLLRLNLFPASLVSPKTAFTFSVLDEFEIDTMECKTSAMNFFSKLRRRTNNAFPGRVPVRHTL